MGVGRQSAKAHSKRDYRLQSNNLWRGHPHKGQDKAATIRFYRGNKACEIQVKEGASARLRCE